MQQSRGINGLMIKCDDLRLIPAGLIERAVGSVLRLRGGRHVRLYMLRVARCGCWRPLCRTLSLNVQLCTVRRTSAAPVRLTLSLLLYIEREKTERQKDKEMFQMHDVTGLSLIFSHSLSPFLPPFLLPLFLLASLYLWPPSLKASLKRVPNQD